MSGTVCSKAIYRTKVRRYNWHSAGSPGWPFPMVDYSVYFSNKIYGSNFIEQHTHTHTRLTAPLPGLPRWAGTRKVKPIWILLKQKTVSGSGISWDICKSAPHSRQITTPAPHSSVFLQAGCPSCRPTNSVKALKAADPLLLLITEPW